MIRSLCRSVLLASLLTLAPWFVPAETLRGPGISLVIDTARDSHAVNVGVEDVLLISLGESSRFLDALDIELASPSAVADHAGAVTVSILAPISHSDRSGVADVVGDALIVRPLIRAGRTFYQVVVSEEALLETSGAVVRPPRAVPSGQFPIALSIVPQLKGLSPALQDAEFVVTVRPVLRDLGALRLTFEREDGTSFADRLRSPGFALTIDGSPVTVAEEYLLSPGLHRIALTSRQYVDQQFTVGIERGRETRVTVLVEVARATVNYTAPRDSRVYINGSPLDASHGDFTVPPGEHTMVVLVGDYSVTRRFRVEEGRSYTVSVLMDIVVEEIK